MPVRESTTASVIPGVARSGLIPFSDSIKSARVNIFSLLRLKADALIIWRDVHQDNQVALTTSRNTGAATMEPQIELFGFSSQT